VKRFLIVFHLFVVAFASALAQTVTLQAPEVCEVGQRINISYKVDTQDVDDIQVGNFSGFDLLYGPSTSSQSSFQMINGKTTHSSSLTFTYVLLAKKEGEYKLPAASVKVNGKTIRSGVADITILPASTPNQSSGQSSSSSSSSSRQSSSSDKRVSDKDLFITATISKTKVFEQEAVLLTYKLYTLVNIRQLMGEMPELDGFHCQELNSKAQLSLKYEHYNGRNYGTAIWRQYLLYPQNDGKLTIPSVSFDAEIEVANQSADPFDIFFGGGSLTQIVSKKIRTPKLEVDVRPLPQPRPTNFSGAVGKFSMTGTLSPEQLNANDAAALQLVVSGQGNMKLMKAPVTDFPKDFEVYNPKETDKTSNTANGAKGNVVYDYVVVPRHGGKYAIAPAEFVYFNPETEKYVTLKTDSFHMAVAKGNVVSSATSASEKEDVRVLSSDIHYIKTNKANIREHVDGFFGTWKYIGIYVGLLAVFFAVLAIFHRQAKANADLVRKRGKRAGKEATKRLKVARKLLNEQNAAAFYEEVLRALLGYVANKLNISTTHLTKDNVRESLSTRGVDEKLIEEYMSVLESCEFARFAPGDPQATMDKIYESASQVINDLNKNL
jgi:hypothetical protein